MLELSGWMMTEIQKLKEVSKQVKKHMSGLKKTQFQEIFFPMVFYDGE